MDMQVKPRIKGTLRIMDRKAGDIKIVWDSDNEDEVAHAKKTFDDLRAKGFSAFSVKKGGEKGTLLTAFDPDVQSMILVPRIVGG